MAAHRLNDRDPSGATALHIAAGKNYLKGISMLAAAKANLDIKDFTGWTPMHCAAGNGYADSVAVLLHAKAAPHALSEVRTGFWCLN